MKTCSNLFAFSFIFLQIFSSQINSQGTDSCTSSLNLKNKPLFDTTSFLCVSVWDAQGYILRYMQTDTKVWSFVLSAPNSNSFIGMGFSRDGKMVGSSAIVGWVSNDGSATMKRYFLGGQSPSEVMPDQGNLELVNMTSSVVAENSRIYMAFQLNTEMPSNRLIYSLGPTGRLPSSVNYQLSEHRQHTSTFLDYNSGQSESKSPYANLRRTHGLLNMFGWGILIPIGAMVARYLRQYDPIWFYSHITIQSLGFLLGFAAIICGFVLEDRLGVDVDRHKTLGIFILVLGCLQVIAFLARPGKESKVRKYWNWYHYTLGRVLILLAAGNIFYGIHLGDAGTAWNVGFAVTLIVFFITAVILEIRMWMKK
ncbi:cytochrome b561 and DOMON domain-containing protein At3g07570-like [Lycium ferocissimum]|uniref:cytochrome b561 and DOMON domain-containing protein At3g07570-like n=1 Tax=Lycium ferocissimum TaxID=112874 RepID=UPI00281572C7|nr:cytochrome b561 and DOMON domain-containing protein At3g07570-like [Lycium ferocissimum]